MSLSGKSNRSKNPSLKRDLLSLGCTSSSPELPAESTDRVNKGQNADPTLENFSKRQTQCTASPSTSGQSLLQSEQTSEIYDFLDSASRGLHSVLTNPESPSELFAATKSPVTQQSEVSKFTTSDTDMAFVTPPSNTSCHVTTSYPTTNHTPASMLLMSLSRETKKGSLSSTPSSKSSSSSSLPACTLSPSAASWPASSLSSPQSLATITTSKSRTRDTDISPLSMGDSITTAAVAAEVATTFSPNSSTATSATAAATKSPENVETASVGDTEESESMQAPLRKRRHPPDEPTKKMIPNLPPCKVCRTKASGFHYGANTCEGCKGFFRRALKTRTIFQCVGVKNCDVIGVNRKLCAYCRYQKCLAVGMSKTAIKIGRYTSETRSRNVLEARLAKQQGLAADESPEAAQEEHAIAPHADDEKNSSNTTKFTKKSKVQKDTIHESFVNGTQDLNMNSSQSDVAHGPSNQKEVFSLLLAPEKDTLSTTQYNSLTLLAPERQDRSCTHEASSKNKKGIALDSQLVDLFKSPCTHHGVCGIAQPIQQNEFTTFPTASQNKWSLEADSSPGTSSFESCPDQDAISLSPIVRQETVPQVSIDLANSVSLDFACLLEDDQTCVTDHVDTSVAQSNVREDSSWCSPAPVYSPCQPSATRRDVASEESSVLSDMSSVLLDQTLYQTPSCSTALTDTMYQSSEHHSEHEENTFTLPISRLTNSNIAIPTVGVCGHEQSNPTVNHCGVSFGGETLVDDLLAASEASYDGDCVQHTSPVASENHISSPASTPSPSPWQTNTVTPPSTWSSTGGARSTKRGEYDMILWSPLSLSADMMQFTPQNSSLPLSPPAQPLWSSSFSSASSPAASVGASPGPSTSSSAVVLAASGEAQIEDQDQERLEIERSLIEILKQPWAFSDERTVKKHIQLLERFQRLNAARSESVVRPICGSDNERLDSIIHDLLVAHNNSMLVSTYFPESFILDRQLSFLKGHQLREQLFGEVKVIPMEDYLYLYRNTGMDIDGRLPFIKAHIMYLESYVQRLVKFAKCIPGFGEMDLEDQILMLKKSRTGISLLGSFRGFNSQLNICVFPNGRCLHRKDMRNFFSPVYADIGFKTADSLKKEVWLPEELVILKALLFTLIDKRQFHNPKAVENLQNLLLTCLKHSLRKSFPDCEPLTLVGQALTKLSLIRPVRNMTCPGKREMFHEFYQRSPLLREIMDPDV
ncbi:signaling mucin MSB2 [Aplysia californica]|uniref:Signaling mucin MSB2 n=1 Tax=Aplysia californica TaxID=6500 RepID=A0ABM0JU96_APLCA|nr:signaling mucin MSB2 [Aplysia californica]